MTKRWKRALTRSNSAAAAGALPKTLRQRLNQRGVKRGIIRRCRRSGLGGDGGQHLPPRGAAKALIGVQHDLPGKGHGQRQRIGLRGQRIRKPVQQLRIALRDHRQQHARLGAVVIMHRHMADPGGGGDMLDGGGAIAIPAQTAAAPRP